MEAKMKSFTAKTVLGVMIAISVSWCLYNGSQSRTSRSEQTKDQAIQSRLLKRMLQLFRRQEEGDPSPPIRLEGGDLPSAGRVEVWYNGTWGTICDDNFDVNGAHVVCRMLGYDIESPFVLRNDNFGPGSEIIWLDNVQCNGTEENIFDCQHNVAGRHNCAHNEDVGVDCNPGDPSPPIRLEGGDLPSAGRVEVWYNGTWGTICDANFDANGARVVCRMLGYDIESPFVLRNENFGPGSGIIWLDNVQCNGTEENIFDCQHNVAGRHNCAHNEDVGVDCDPGDPSPPIRLEGGDLPSAGRVEVWYNGTWGTICDDNFDVNGALVVCRMLGYDIESPFVLRNENFGPGSGIIWLDNVQCNGTEENIFDCQHNDVGIDNCGHNEDVGIDCNPETISPPVRLVNGRLPSQGLVEVWYQGIWGTVCDDSFDVTDARVICRMLGYNVESPLVYKSLRYGQGSGLIWLDEVQCNGSEESVFDCGHNILGNHNCGHMEDVGINCQPTEVPPTPIRLVDGAVPSEGRVEVWFEGDWGSVCDDSFGLKEARVACRMMGYNVDPPYILNANEYTQGTGAILLDNVVCTGTEESIFDCSHYAVGTNYCSHQDDVGLNCNPTLPSPPIRLVGGTQPSQGRVEVYYKGEWGTVCDSEFNLFDANVVCRTLGYTSYVSYGFNEAIFGENNESVIWLDNVACYGNESNIFYCQNTIMGGHTCSHNKNVGVDCLPDLPTPPIRLVDGIEAEDGRVEVFYKGEWGTVCGDSFDVRDAVVVCRMLGYDISTPFVFHQDLHGEGNGTIWLDDMECNGTEDNIFLCQHNDLNNCEHNQDVSVDCHPYIPENVSDSIRLVDGERPSEGRVEISYKGVWGTVCDDGFDTWNARVVCRMLGYNIDTPYFHPNSHNGSGNGTIWLDQVVCSGTEENIFQCQHNTFGTHDCTHSEDVGVDCDPTLPDTLVRLVGGVRPSQGRVEVWYNNEWGTVCDDSFDVLGALVVCRMQGYENEVMPTVIFDGNFGSDSGNESIWLDEVQCRGDEPSIFQCSHNSIGLHDCRHTEDVGVDCEPYNPENASESIRLVDGERPSEGRVEISYNGVWGTMCDDGFDTRSARVVCRMLGYNIDTPYFHPNSHYGSGNGTIWLDQVVCSGTEENIFLCQRITFGTHNCTHSEDVGVDCDPTLPDTLVRLVGGVRPSQGRVEVWYNNEWGTVCDDSFDVLGALVVCRMLGYENEVEPTVIFGKNRGSVSGNESIWLDEVQCRGDETSIFQCSHNSIGLHDCRHTEDVGVDCEPGGIIG